MKEKFFNNYTHEKHKGIRRFFMGTEIKVQRGDSPCRIARRELGPNASNTEVAIYAKSIMEANHITDSRPMQYNPNKPTTIILPDAPIFDTAKKEKSNHTAPLDGWMDKVANGKKPKPFAVVPKEDIAENGEISRKNYSKNLFETSRKHIKLYDKNGDGIIDLKEQIRGDLLAARKRYGSLDAEDKAAIIGMAKQTHKFIDTDNKGIDENKYALFVYLTDKNDNGSIDNKEYEQSIGYILSPSTKKAKAFRAEIERMNGILANPEPVD